MNKRRYPAFTGNLQLNNHVAMVTLRFVLSGLFVNSLGNDSIGLAIDVQLSIFQPTSEDRIFLSFLSSFVLDELIIDNSEDG